jgi:hypothetical protein
MAPRHGRLGRAARRRAAPGSVVAVVVLRQRGARDDPVLRPPEGDTFERRLAHARRNLSDDFVTLFDRHLVEAGDALVADPADIGAKVDFVTSYHMVIEGTLALTGQNFITRAFEERGILPGFTEGFRRIATDEHRHVAYGTWFLQQRSSDPGCAGASPTASSRCCRRRRACSCRPARTRTTGRCSATAPRRSTRSRSPR